VQDDAAWRENFEELEAYVAREGHPHVRKDCGELGQVLCLLRVRLRVCAPGVKDMCKMNVKMTARVFCFLFFFKMTARVFCFLFFFKMTARVFSLHLWLHPVENSCPSFDF
jgi:hypothetical protein